MKAFGAAVLFTFVLATTAGLVLQGSFTVPADAAFATPSVRIGEEPTVHHRNLSGTAGN